MSHLMGKGFLSRFGRFVTLPMSFAISALIARIYGIHETGLYTMVVTEVGIISTVLVFGTPLSMWGTYSSDCAKQSFAANIKILKYTTLIAIPVAVMFLLYAAEPKRNDYYVIAASAFCCSLVMIAKNYYLLKGSVEIFFFLDIIYYAVFVLLLLTHFVGNTTILWCIPVSYVFVVLFLAWRERKANWTGAINGERFTARYLYASFAALCGSFAWLLVVRMSYLIISSRFGLSEVGQYSVIAGVCEAASTLISSLMIADLGKLKRQEKTLASVLKQQMVIVLLFAILFMLCGPYCLSMIYGVQADILQALAPPLVTAAVLFVAFRALQNKFLLAGKTWEYFASNLVVLASYVGLVWLSKDLRLVNIAWIYAAAALAGLVYASLRHLRWRGAT